LYDNSNSIIGRPDLKGDTGLLRNPQRPLNAHYRQTFNLYSCGHGFG